MSTKTLRKRIALIAASTLTAGVLSVVTAPVANAVTTLQAEQNVLILATTADADGTAASSLTQAANQTFSQVGYVADTSATTSTTTGGIFVGSSAIRTATVLAGAQIAFKATGSDTVVNGTSVVVTGGTLAISAATTADAITLGTGSTHGLNSTRTAFFVDTAAAEDATSKNGIAGVFTVTAAVGSVATIALYSGAAITGTSTATAGTFMGQYTLTVVAANTVGVLSTADSTVTQQACMANATTGTSGSNTFDTVSRCGNGTAGVVYLDLNDGNSSNILTGTVTATSSAGVIIGSETTTTGSIVNSATQSFSTLNDTTDGVMWFYAKQPTANTAGSTTITITYNGSVIGTKTINWAGQASALEVNEALSCKIFSVAQTADTTEGNIGDGCVVYTVKDASGNTVTMTSSPTVSATTGALAGATTSATTVSDFTIGYNLFSNTTQNYGFTTLVIPSNSLSGASSYQLQLTNASGVVIKSQVVNVTVSRGSTTSFTASWDKAAYKTGDIATLTISLKDAYGNLMANGTTLAALGTLVLDVNSAGMATIGTACSGTSTVTAGVKTCKYSALNTEGSFAYTVDVVTAVPQDATIGTLPITASTSTVSNAEVLKSIVALIASINKQIQALQKLILKR